MNWLAVTNATELAIETIRAHKLRALLTVIGIVIGTGTIIGVAAILTGFDSSMTSIFRSFGPNSIIVFKFQAGFRTSRPTPEERARKDLVYQNVLDIREKCDACEQVSPLMFPPSPNYSIQARYKGNDMYNITCWAWMNRMHKRAR